MERLRHKNIKLVLDDKAKDFLVEKGYDPQYGARPMRRAVERFLEDPLAEEILQRQLAAGRTHPGHERQGKTGVQPEGGGRRRGGELKIRSI